MVKHHMTMTQNFFDNNFYKHTNVEFTNRYVFKLEHKTAEMVSHKLLCFGQYHLQQPSVVFAPRVESK